jgi:hypothetical protein
MARGLASSLAIMTNVALHITNLPNKAAATRKDLPCAVVDNSSIVIKSQLSQELPLNEHLVWLWGMLKHERRYLKTLQSEGAVITVRVSSARFPVEVKPNGAEMLHLLGASLVIDGKSNG